MESTDSGGGGKSTVSLDKVSHSKANEYGGKENKQQ